MNSNERAKFIAFVNENQMLPVEFVTEERLAEIWNKTIPKDKYLGGIYCPDEKVAYIVNPDVSNTLEDLLEYFYHEEMHFIFDILPSKFLLNIFRFLFEEKVCGQYGVLKSRYQILKFKEGESEYRKSRN